jgi:acetyl-CoA synthetase
MLPNIAPLWEVMLAAMKLGAVIIPATTLLTPEDLHDRLRRGAVRHLITDGEGAERCAGLQGDFTRIVVGARVAGWTSYDDALAAPAAFAPEGESRPEDPFLLYFTSGTTARPKPVVHSHQSYPVGHLSTLYWIGLREDDVHLNISSPGWAKHAWSSFFAPWNAGATVVVHNYARFSGRRTLEQMIRCGVTTLCAPPTVWRLLIQKDLASYPARLRAAVSAGEPLNPEVIAQVQRSWGITIREGYGQTETTAVVGNTPGQPVRPGSMGRPLPGYRVALLDAGGREGDEGEIALRLDARPLRLILVYLC